MTKTDHGKLDRALILCGGAVSSLGNQTFNICLIFFLKAATNSPAVIANYMAAASIPTILFALFGGVLSDRFSKRRIMIVTDLVSSVLFTAFAIGFAFAKPNSIGLVVLAYGVRVAASTLQSFFQPASGALLMQVTAPEDRQKVISVQSFLMRSVQIAGDPIGGALFALLAFPIIALINGVSFFVSAVSELFISPDSPQISQGSRKGWSAVWSSLADGWGYLRGRKDLQINLSIATAINFFLVPVSIILPFFVEDVLKVHLINYALLGSIYLVGGLASSWILGVAKVEPKRRPTIFFISLLLYIACLALVPLQDRIGSIYVLYFSAGFFQIAYTILISTSVNRSLPNEYRGRYLGFERTVLLMTVPVGAFIGGWVIDTYQSNLRELFFLCAAMPLVAILVAAANSSFRQLLSK